MNLPPLPEPCIYEGDDSPMYDAPTGYTAEQMQAYGQQCRSEALEEAAQVCDERANGENDAQYCADRIRSLKS